MRHNLRASVVICTYNRALSLQNTLNSIEKLNVPASLPWELLIVDNNSSDSTKQTIERFSASTDTDFTVKYCFERQQGLSAARNLGIKKSKGEIIIFTDDDMEFSPNWICHILTTFEKFDCLCVAGKILPKWRCEKPIWFNEKGPYRTRAFHGEFDLGGQMKQIDKAPFGGNMAFKRSVFEQYGDFRTDLGKSGTNHMSNEETELCQRIFVDGHSIVYCPEAVVYHLIEKDQTSKKYILTRNFSHGKSSARMKEYPAIMKLYFGIPIGLWRNLITCYLKWLFEYNSTKRFYYKHKFYHIMGKIDENFKRWQRTRVKLNT